MARQPLPPTPAAATQEPQQPIGEQQATTVAKADEAEDGTAVAAPESLQTPPFLQEEDPGWGQFGWLEAGPVVMDLKGPEIAKSMTIDEKMPQSTSHNSQADGIFRNEVDPIFVKEVDPSFAALNHSPSTTIQTELLDAVDASMLAIDQNIDAGLIQGCAVEPLGADPTAELAEQVDEAFAVEADDISG